jgi:uncharacterized membrane protein YedE/YeeE
MYAEFGFETLTAPQAAVLFGLALGLVFGALAEVTAFCLRRAVAGAPGERRSAAGVWLAALATALLGTQAAVQAGLVDFSAHRFMAADLPWLAILAGGLIFGAGMVLTRGCISRLTVLTGSGNLRALTVLLVFALTAHAALKGVLSPIRTGLGSVTASLGEVTSLAALPGGAALWTAVLAIAALAFAARSGARRLHLALALVIGLLAPLGWVGTGFLLYDDFDPVAMESLSFTLPAAETLFWGVASTAIGPTFGVGLLGGTLAGALALSLLGGRFRWQSFEGPRQTARYMAGGAMMGLGGVLAGGCTLGAGLSGVPTLSFAALLAIGSIVAGGWLTARLMEPRAARAAPVPAE